METHIEADRLQILYNKKPCYDIVYETSFEALTEELLKLGAEQKRLCIITDSKVEKLYGSDLCKKLRHSQKAVLFLFRKVKKAKHWIRSKKYTLF